MNDADRHFAAETVRLLLEADLRSSGAKTPAEIREALVCSLTSLVRPPEVAAVSHDPETNSVVVEVRPAMLPGGIPFQFGKP